MTKPEIPAGVLGAAIIKLGQDMMKLGAVVSALGATMYFLLEPRIEQEKQIFQNEVAMAVLVAIGRQPEPFIEIDGAPVLAGKGPFKAGETVPLLYFLRRNSDCTTDVEVQFIQSDRGVRSEYSYVIPSTRASASFDFVAFTVNVRLPANMRSGLYSYSPVLRPSKSECPQQRPVKPPPSQFFEVVAPG